MTQPPPESPDDLEPTADALARAAREAVQRKRRAEREPEPSLGSRLGQIVLPTLLGLAIGHWLDKHFATGVFFSALLLMVGAAIGLWSAWKWMHRQTRQDRP